MKWPWRREPDGGQASGEMQAMAEEQLDSAREQIRQINRVIHHSRVLLHQTDQFAQDIQDALRLRRPT